MSFYEDRVLPHLINCACGMDEIMALREQVVPRCKGEVLEVGMGSGLNLRYYDTQRVSHVWGLEPSAGMRRRAQKALDESPVEVRWLDLPGEAIPLDDHSVDTVLLTYTLCTIPDPQTALAQMKRVLRPGGELLFAEHGWSPDAKVSRWQDRINPLWGKVFGGCNLNRAIDRLIADAGFSISELETRYMDGSPRFVGHVYTGVATLAA